MATSSSGLALDAVESLIGIGDPDAPIYRIFPLWMLGEAIRLRSLALVDVLLWEDPYERLPHGVAVTDKSTRPWKQIMVERLLRPAFVQAWSYVGDCQTLFRAYSRVCKDPVAGRNMYPHLEGVQVRSTPRKLLRALCSWCPTDAARTCFIGRVQYHKDCAQLMAHVGNMLRSRGPEECCMGRGRAELLLQKRGEYRHEAEVRLIYIEHRESRAARVLQIPFDPNEVFEEVRLDYRINGLDEEDREALLRSAGYRNKIAETDLNTRYLMEIEAAPDIEQRWRLAQDRLDESERH